MESSLNRFYTPVYDEKILGALENEFSRLRDEHYLDHVGTTLYSDSQMKNISNDMLNSLYANPHSAGLAGNLTHDIIERTRNRLLDHFHASPDEYSLVFTSGTTAALKSVAESFIFGNDEEFGNFVYLQDNHTSVLGMRDLVARKGAKISCLGHAKAFKIMSEKSERNFASSKNATNSLFAFSAQCNFTGFKYPLEWIDAVQNGILDKISSGKSASRWYVLLDAASFVGTNELDLQKFKPDFLCLSFYKMFGYPTGTGALLVRKSSADALEKVYYGGGTVNLAMSLTNFHVKRDSFHERYEDGTLAFLAIVSLQHGLDAMSKVPLEKISRHVFSLARYLHHSLACLYHHNGEPLAKLYCDTNYEDPNRQGGVVTFNLLRSNGHYVGYTEVSHMAAIFKIHLRTGCFCNPGACQRQLGLTDRDIMQNYDAGYTCGGSRDLIDGRPTGAVRISFGYMSTPRDVEAVLEMFRKCFLSKPEVIRVPTKFLNPLEDFPEIFSNGTKENGGNMSLKRHEVSTGIEDRKLVELDESPDLHRRKDSGDWANQREGVMRLKKMFIYPIKSCAAYEVTDSWLLTDRGLQYDREWMIVTSAGICLSQKQQVKLCLLRPKVCRKKNLLILNYPGMPSAQVSLDLGSRTVINNSLFRSRVCGHRVEGIDCGPEVSEWLSLALGRPNLRLIRQNIVKMFSKEDASKPELSFSSQAQYLLINEASIQWIIDNLPEDADCPPETILYRFRGNMVLQGSEPFRETKWTRIQIGKHAFQVDGPCTRCQMVCIDQTTGKKTAEPLRLIAEEFEGKMRFGMYLSRLGSNPVTINIGDPISVK